MGPGALPFSPAPSWPGAAGLGTTLMSVCGGGSGGGGGGGLSVALYISQGAGLCPVRVWTSQGQESVFPDCGPSLLRGLKTVEFSGEVLLLGR